MRAQIVAVGWIIFRYMLGSKWSCWKPSPECFHRFSAFNDSPNIVSGVPSSQYYWGIALSSSQVLSERQCFNVSAYIFRIVKLLVELNLYHGVRPLVPFDCCWFKVCFIWNKNSKPLLFLLSILFRYFFIPFIFESMDYYFMWDGSLRQHVRVLLISNLSLCAFMAFNLITFKVNIDMWVDL